MASSQLSGLLSQHHQISYQLVLLLGLDVNLGGMAD